MNKFDLDHIERLSKINTSIRDIYIAIIEQAAKIGLTIVDFNPDKQFSFAKYPTVEKKINALIGDLHSQIKTTVLNAIESAWYSSSDKTNSLLKEYLKGTNVDYEDFINLNLEGLNEFKKRINNGLGLSSNVWDISNNFYNELEIAFDDAFLNGTPSSKLATKLKSSLNNPDKLFRRVKNSRGDLVLSKNAKAFNPGQGVYRSSYKNARRLAVTETNMAYRTADHERWNSLDFVVGYEVKLSNNHTCNGVSFTDICDTLAGKYPKTFRFVGWHPHCKCIAIPILMQGKEKDLYFSFMKQGKSTNEVNSLNEVKNIPNNFTNYYKENKDRLNKGQPYFIRDNQQFVSALD